VIAQNVFKVNRSVALYVPINEFAGKKYSLVSDDLKINLMPRRGCNMSSIDHREIMVVHDEYA